MILSPSMLSADFSVLGKQIKEIEAAGAPWLHIDVMDGVFVPNISFGMPIITATRKATNLVLDVHAMIIDPDKYIDDFFKCGADILTFHIEALPKERILLESSAISDLEGVNIELSICV